MANYKVNSKSKTVSVSGELTEIERNIIAAYITSGYTVKEKRVATAARISNNDILKYFESLGKEAGTTAKTAYENKKKEKKDGKEIGFLGAAKWFKENYYVAYDRLMEEKENNKEKSLERRKKAAEAAKKIYVELAAAAAVAEAEKAVDLEAKKAAKEAAGKYAKETNDIYKAAEAAVKAAKAAAEEVAKAAAEKAKKELEEE